MLKVLLILSIFFSSLNIYGQRMELKELCGRTSIFTPKNVFAYFVDDSVIITFFTLGKGHAMKLFDISLNIGVEDNDCDSNMAILGSSSGYNLLLKNGKYKLKSKRKGPFSSNITLEICTGKERRTFHNYLNEVYFYDDRQKIIDSIKAEVMVADLLDKIYKSVSMYQKINILNNSDFVDYYKSKRDYIVGKLNERINN
jgi:hypothetical protein